MDILPSPLWIRSAATIFVSGLLAARAFGVGATVPFVSYEAESGTLGGGAAVRALAVPATDATSSPELEASGRAFVELNATGESVTWTNSTGKNVNVMDVRYSIPDAPTGGGIDATLNLYVDGVFRQAIPLSSKQIWLYDEPAGTAGADSWNGMGQDPSLGNPHIFYEEAHFWITGAPIAPGSTIMLRKDSDNTADFYWIDIADLELAPAAITQPANSLSITSYGAVATPTFSGPLPASPVDCTTAIKNCIAAAKTQKKTVWIPPGRYVTKASISATSVTIEGAGVWYSKLYRNLDLPVTSGPGSVLDVDSCTLRNFFVDANATSRYGADGDGGGINVSGNNWLMDTLWIQHTSSGVWAKGTNGLVRNCRVLSAWGDGVNLNNGNTNHVGNNLTADNNYVRGVGDDGVTINSDITSTQMDTVVLKNNTTVAVYWADGLRVAGGKNVLVQNNLLVDPVKFPGIIIGTFNGQPLENGIVEGNTIIRGGGNAYNQHKSALDIGPGTPYIANVIVRNNIIRDSIQYAVKFQSSSNIFFENNTVDGVWEGSLATRIGKAINVISGSTGSAVLNNNVVQNLLSGQTAFTNSATSSTYSMGGIGNTGFSAAGAIPSPWQSQTIGTATPLGGASLAGNVLTVAGGGANIDGTADAFQFTQQPISGDCTVTARISNLENIDAGSKSGIMIRDGLVSSSANAALVATPDGSVAFQYRAASGGATAISASAAVGFPCWVRLTRQGGAFTAACSTDGSAWTTLGSTISISMANNVSAGLAITSHKDGTFSSSMIDRLALASLPASNWQAQDIGSTAFAGGNAYSASAGTFSITGSGADIGGTADAFHFTYRAITGDGTITARVASLQNTNNSAKAGVMMRSSLDPGGIQASVFVTPASGISFQRRTATGGTTASSSATGVAAPYWVRLVRSGTTFTASRSTNGTTWTTVGSAQQITMGTTIYVGLAVSSRDNTRNTNAVFDNVSFIAATPPPDGFSATPLSETQLQLSWVNHADNGTSVVLQRSPQNANTWSTIASLAPSTTSFIDASLNASIGYDFRVRCDSPDGSSSYATLSVTMPAGIGDGIPGAWRLLYFGNGLALTSDSGLHADPDGDGSDNQTEYLAATSPIDSASALKIDAISTSGSDVRIAFRTVTGKNYQVERSGTLGSDANWTPVQGPVPGTNDVITVTDPGALSQPKRFYRVQLE
jgi:regulation of enolase protein 1 (concanavalin A-like superfamily)